MQYIVDEPIEGYDIFATIRESNLKAEKKANAKVNVKPIKKLLSIC